MKRVFKDDVQVTIGPWIENGFYYDFYRKEQISDKDLKRIKKEMDKIIKADLPIVREVVPREEARARLLAEGETFKVEVLDGITDETISFYRIGDEWWDLCAGPHVPSTGAIKPKAVALQSVAGAYWPGQDKRAKFPTSKAHISAVFHSFRLIFGRAIISRNGLEAWVLFPERARAEHSR